MMFGTAWVPTVTTLTSGIGGAGGALDASEGTDFHATAQGHLSLTPLSVDLTDHAALAYWAQGLGHMMAGEKP